MLRGGKRSNFYFILALSILMVFFYFGKSCFAVNNGDIVINEIAWMGNLESSYDEWIELRNLSNNDISLEDWTLVAQDGSPNINLSGSISAFGYFILERSNDDSAPSVIADLIYIGALKNTGEVLELRDAGGNLVDSVDGGNGWIGGDSDTKQTMMQDESGIWVTSEEACGTPRDFNTSPPPSPTGEEENSGDEGGDNSVATSTSSNNEETEAPLTEATESDSVSVFSLGDIVVNELVSDPADKDVEWVELYNNLDIEINLEGWTIEEGSGAITKLKEIIGVSGDTRYYIVEKPKGNLNNKGDIIILRDNLGTLIDRVAYGEWDDGDISNNAPFVTDPNSIARKINGFSSYNDKNDFAITTVLTKGSANIIKEDSSEKEEGGEEEEVSAEDKSKYDYSDDIIISEIFPNPFGFDSEDEFIELYNSGTRDVDLRAWKISDSSKKRFEIKIDEDKFQGSSLASLFKDDKAVLKKGEYLVIYRSESSIVLNNTSDSVKLFQPLEDIPYEVVEYDEVVEGWSYNLADVASLTGLPRRSASRNDDFNWSESITPGKENVIKYINKEPDVSVDWPRSGTIGAPILFDSSDTVDKERDKLKFFWDFGDGFTNILANPEHTYFNSGVFTVTVTVSDGVNEVKEEKILKVKSKLIESHLNEATHSAGPEQVENDSLASLNVVINEILPNPEGADSEGEWIEIKNIGNEKINLLNWIVDDSEGGSKPFKFNSNLWLEPGGLYTLDRVDSNIALNNSVDSVRLYSDFEELIDEIEYEKAVEGEAYAKGKNGKLFWTSVITPSKDNIVKVASSNYISNSGITAISENKKTNEPFYISLDKISDVEPGDTVITKGVVSVLPGILGVQYFYISLFEPQLNPSGLAKDKPLLAQESGSAELNSEETDSLLTEATESDPASKLIGIQVYNYKKDFPNFRVGDYIEVIGELGIAYGEKRIKTKVKEDMVILERDKEIKVIKYDCIDINEEIIGALIRVEGEIVERKSSIVYLDDGTDEVRLYIKKATGINLKSLKEGGAITAIGIVGKTKSGIRVMPRSPEDIIISDIESNGDTVGQVLGEVSISDEWEIAKRDKKLELFKYVLVIASTIIIILSYLLFKEIRK